MKTTPSTLIVGYGITGKNLHREIAALNPDICDIDSAKIPPEHQGRNYSKYDAIFVCVDTPYIPREKRCDITAVEMAIEQHKEELAAGGVFVIKSTIPPHTTSRLNNCFPDEAIIHSPEYYGDTQHCNNFDFDFTVLGGRRKWCNKVQSMLQMCHDARHRFFVVDAAVAELAKYMENSFLATKVSFCVEFFRIAKDLDIDYNAVREIFIQDPRISPSHTFVYPDAPYWDSHCLNKDVATIADNPKAYLLRQIINFNNQCKKKSL